MQADRAALQWAWNTNNASSDGTPYATQPVGDSVALARAVATKYATAVGGAYTAYANTDVTGSGAAMMTAWNRDPAVLQWLCDQDPTCVGFNSLGGLKNSTAGRAARTGVTLWLKAA